MPPKAVSLFGISLHSVTMSAAIDLVQQWMLGNAPCRYVVTPNVDHIVKLQNDSAMQAAYRDAALVVADGWPLVAASKFIGRPLPERVAGSDLVPALLDAGRTIRDYRVFLLGAAPGVADVAAERIEARWPGTKVCGVSSPAPGFELSREQCAAIVDAINNAAPHLLIVGLGAPKQEIWIHNHAAQLNARVAICAGATIDFLAGVQRRAPRWIQALRLEWLYRMARDPRRLASRYLRDAVVFPRLVAAEWRKSPPRH